jgi:hypothetical protein
MTANGYTTIEIAGRKVGLKFNMYAIEQFETIKGRAGKAQSNGDIESDVLKKKVVTDLP